LQNRLFCLCRLPAVYTYFYLFNWCIVYCCIWTVTLAKSIVPTKNMTKIVTLLHF
jgi:uncharacterized MAPEG superfamily protein